MILSMIRLLFFLCCTNVKIVMNARNILKMKTLESKLILYTTSLIILHLGKMNLNTIDRVVVNLKL